MEKKKPSFKAPAFSVPSKAGADKNAVNNSCVKESKNSNTSKDEEKKEKKAVGNKAQIKEKKSKLKTGLVSGAGDSASVKQVDSGGDGTLNMDTDDNQENISDTIDIPDCAGDQIKEQNEIKEDEDIEKEDMAEESEKSCKKDKVKSSLGKRKQEACTESKKEKKNEKKMSLPTRALTDEEYEEIFAATIDNALNMDIDDWTPQCTKEKKYKKRIGKPTSSQEEKREKEKKKSIKEFALKDKTNKDKTLKEPNGSKMCQEEKVDESVKGDEAYERKDDMEKEGNENDVNMELEEDTEETSRNQEPERVEAQVDPQVEAQVENETTPVGSGDEQTAAVVPHSPPHKKMKPNKPPKKTKLVPKHLPFEKKAIEKKKKEKKVTVRKDKHPDKKNSEKKKMSSPSEVKVSGKMSDRRREMISRNINVQGTWVQCCRMDCKKWRYLPSVTEPSKIPEYWTCSMNTREDYNSCEKPEESYDETDHIYTKYCEGSVVLAKMAGYPWWPAMIEVDPDYDVFCWIDKNNTMLPTHYHVVFLDEKVSRVWLKASQILPFNGEEEIMFPDTSKSKKRGPSYGKELGIAKRNALNALDYPIQERIKLFGFATKFKGQWSTENLKVNTGVTQKDKTKQLKRKIDVPTKAETIDESTMDDVLDNTEALLSNVEEMLDSLDSQIYDSNEDSDFSVSELVVVEGKKRETRKERGNVKRTLAQIYSDSSDQEIEVEETDEQKKELDDGINLTKLEPADNAVLVKGTTVSFDKDVFTMELDHEENDNIVDIVDDLNSSGLGMEVKDGDITQGTVDEKNDIVNEGAKEAITQESICENEKSELEQKDVTDENENKAKSDKRSKSKKSAKNMGESKPAKKSQAFKKPSTTKTQKEAKEDLNSSETTNEHKQDPDVNVQYNENSPEPANTETNSPKVDAKESLTIESHQTDIDVNIDTKDNKIDTDSPLISPSDNDALVPEVKHNMNMEPDVSQNEGISLEDEAEVGFDLEDHSMYEGDTGADKIIERAIVMESSDVIPTAVAFDEDSDPFDMIEE